MPAFKLFLKLVVYYAGLAALIAIAMSVFPAWREYLPIGRVQSLLADTSVAELAAEGGGLSSGIKAGPVLALGPSLIWLTTAVFGALLASLPVSWVYMEIREPGDYDQSLIDTIVVLPLVVTSIVVVVQHSLALAFSLAGIAGAARFRNTLKSSADLLFILLAIGVGLSAGIGALELALVTSAAFNVTFVVLWSVKYGERADMKRYLSDVEHPSENHNGHKHHKHDGDVVVTETTSTVVAETTQTTQTVELAPSPDRAP